MEHQKSKQGTYSGTFWSKLILNIRVWERILDIRIRNNDKVVILSKIFESNFENIFKFGPLLGRIVSFFEIYLTDWADSERMTLSLFFLTRWTPSDRFSGVKLGWRKRWWNKNNMFPIIFWGGAHFFGPKK